MYCLHEYIVGNVEYLVTKYAALVGILVSGEENELGFRLPCLGDFFFSKLGGVHLGVVR